MGLSFLRMPTLHFPKWCKVQSVSKASTSPVPQAAQPALRVSRLTPTCAPSPIWAPSAPWPKQGQSGEEGSARRLGYLSTSLHEGVVVWFSEEAIWCQVSTQKKKKHSANRSVPREGVSSPMVSTQIPGAQRHAGSPVARRLSSWAFLHFHVRRVANTGGALIVRLE